MGKCLLHSSTMSDVYLLQNGNIEKRRGSRPGSEVILEREFAVLSNLNLNRIPSVINFEKSEKVLTMTRVGTHDLSDVLHDIPGLSVPYVIRDFFQDISNIHSQGYVHRDIKPGNVMFNCSADTNSTNYAGIVDFGMSLISNRKQNEHFALGGTEPYTHPSQDDREYKEQRCQPGQDWFAAARTMAHLLAGGSTSSFKSLLGKDQGRELFRDVKMRFHEVFRDNAEACKPVLDLIDFSLKPEAKQFSQLYQLMVMGENAVKSLKENIIPEWPQNYGKHSFQTAINQRPKRHDVLLIIDNTGSMAPHVQQVKDAFDEIAELVHGRIDLRVDLWSLGDYSSGENGQNAVIPLGKRMRPDTFQQSLNQMEANREQNDEAEAYEVALQLAYLPYPNEKWRPRKSTTRSIVLVGDAYAHGWLDSNQWRNVITKARGHLDKNTGVRGDPDPEIKALYDDFSRRHPHYMTWEIEKDEREAFSKAKKNKKSLDGKGKDRAGGHVNVQGELFAHRPNYRKAIERCVEQKKATIHTIGSGSNLVSSSFMKYVALQGKGTYTHVGGGSSRGSGNDSELIIALKGIFASVDAKIFRDLEKETLEQNPNTQALNSITTFVIDSMSDDN